MKTKASYGIFASLLIGAVIFGAVVLHSAAGDTTRLWTGYTGLAWPGKSQSFEIATFELNGQTAATITTKIKNLKWVMCAANLQSSTLNVAASSALIVDCNPPSNQHSTATSGKFRAAASRPGGTASGTTTVRYFAVGEGVQ